MKRWLSMTLLAACSFPTPSSQYACETTDDCDSGRVCDRGYCVIGTDIDASLDDVLPDNLPRYDCTGWMPRHFDACAIPVPDGNPLVLAGASTYDTTTGALTGPGGTTTPPSLVVATGRVLSVDSLTLEAGATLRVIGTHPLIVASWTSIAVAGTIDVSSTALELGAGANAAACTVAQPGVNNGNGGGGGGGGGYGGRGGNGGQGDGGNGGAGALPVAMPPLLQGGCAGARGGNADGPGGVAGGGGGGVQLTARTSVELAATARLHAGGAGGLQALVQGGNGQGGGGGAGSGGMIGLEGATIAIAAGAILAANGGGGGEGSGNQQGNAGQPGQLSSQRAPGGAGGSDAGDGGLGGAGLTINGTPGANDNDFGGGGGGGGVGFVVLTSAAAATTTGAVISPAPTIVEP